MLLKYHLHDISENLFTLHCCLFITKITNRIVKQKNKTKEYLRFIALCLQQDITGYLFNNLKGTTII